MLLNEIIQQYGIQVPLLIAGLLGSLLSIRNNQKGGFWGTMTNVVSAALIANYATPLAGLFVTIPPNTQPGVSLVLGFCGIRGFERIVKVTFDRIEAKAADKKEAKEDDKSTADS